MHGKTLKKILKDFSNVGDRELYLVKLKLILIL